MYGDKALELLRELQRCTDILPPFNEDIMRAAMDEINALHERLIVDIEANNSGQPGLHAAIQVQHDAMKRNKRIILAYLMARLRRIRDMRWEFGAVIPETVQMNLCDPEVQWFKQYNNMLTTYMQSITENYSIDLTRYRKPPKSLYIEVRCLEDYGEFVTEDGTTVFLKKNSQHFIPRSQCESLIRQGILQHV